MNRLITVFIVIVLIFPLAAACKNNATDIAAHTHKINIVCTTFPQYDWVRQILGEQIDYMEVSLLQDGRVDLHSYLPTIQDMVKITDCDLFIYVGGESDDWVYDVLRQSTNPNQVAINLLDILGDGAKYIDIIEGMEHNHDDGHDHDAHNHDDGHDHDDHDHDHDDAHDHDEDDGDHDHMTEYDEHVWLSLINAVIFCGAITDILISFDSANTDIYKENLTIYTDKLLNLHGRYHEALNNAAAKTLLFGDRFPFRYLTDDYGLDYYAAFTGCSAETEASFYTIIYLSEKVDELGLNVVMVTESADGSIARTVVDNTILKNQEILVLDSMQSISPRDIMEGASYLSIMEGNLDILVNALS